MVRGGHHFRGARLLQVITVVWSDMTWYVHDGAIHLNSGSSRAAGGRGGWDDAIRDVSDVW